MRHQHPLVVSAAFQRWFDGSKVIDAAGRPRVLYHGTGDDITVIRPYAWVGPFERNRCPHTPDLAVVYLTSVRDLASGFALAAGRVLQKEHQGTLPLYVKAGKLLEVKGVLGYNMRSAERLAARRLTPKDARTWKSDTSMRSTVYLHAYLQGYDGVVFRCVEDDPGTIRGGLLSDIYAFFETASFKSATGNNGAFDPTDPHICR